MDQAAATRAREAINRVGHVVSFRRMTRATPPVVANRSDVKATPTGYAPDQLASGITVGTRYLTVSKLDLVAAGFPVPPIKGDRIYLGDALDVPTTIDTVDSDRREYQACYIIKTTGS